MFSGWPQISEHPEFPPQIRVAKAAITYQSAGTLAYSALGGTTVAPAYPSSIAAGDLLILIIGMKPSTANSGSVTTPSDWTAITGGSLTGAGGFGTTLGADTGNTNVFTFSKTAAGTESGSLTVTLATNNVSWAQMYRFSSDTPVNWSVAATTGSDTTGGTAVSIAMSSNPGVTSGDFIVGAMVIPTDVTTPNQFSAEALSQTGVTFGTVTEISEPYSGMGNDIGGFTYRATVNSGTASAAPILTATAGGTTTNVRGPGVFIRIREIPTVPTLSSSANQTVTVGDAARAMKTATITESATPSITDANNIRIRIPSSLNMTWDTSDTSANIGGTDWAKTGAASQGGTVTVSYEDSNRTVVIPVTTNFSALDDITVYGLSFANFGGVSGPDNLELVTAGSGGATTDEDDKTVRVAPPLYTAYNDCGIYNSSTWRTTGNVTNWGGASTTWGNLIDFSNATNTQVAMAYSGTIQEGYGTENLSGTTYRPPPTYPAASTDSYTEFGTNVNMAGATYGNAGYPVTMTFTGFDNTKTYTLVAFGARGEITYNRYNRYTISGVDGFTNMSSAGTATTSAVTNDSAFYNAGNNYEDGYVAKWTGISTSGTTITLTVTPIAYGGYAADKSYISAVKLVQESVAALSLSSAANQSFTVNDPPTAMATTTITDGATPSVTNANDIRIRIPSSFNMTWYTTDTTANIGGTDWAKTGAASQGGTVSVSYEDSNHTVVIPVTTDFSASDDITVYGLSFDNFTTTTAADNLELVTTGSGGATAAEDDKTIEITPPSVITAASSAGQPSSARASSTNMIFGSASISRSAGTGQVTAVTIKENGTIDAATELGNFELWLSTNDSWDASDNQLGSAATFNGSDEITFTETFSVTTTARYLIIRGNVLGTADVGDTIEIQISALTTGDSTSGIPLDIAGTTTITAGTTIGLFSDPRPRLTTGHQAKLTTDLNQIPLQMENGWVLDAINTGGDHDYISRAGYETLDGAFANSTVASTTRFYHVGNHEVDNIYDIPVLRNKYAGYAAWNLQPGPSSCSTTNYSYDRGDLHVVNLNVYCSETTDATQEPNGGNVPDVLFNWLKNDLRNSNQPYVMVVGHEPAYPLVRHVGDSLDQFPTNRDRLWNLLKTERVPVFLSGHTHRKSNIEYDGVFQLNTGISGGEVALSDYDTFATINYINVDENGLTMRQVSEGGADWSGTPTVVTKTPADLTVQVAVNTYHGAGTVSKYWVDYDSTVEANPDWSSNNSGRWWQTAFDDSAWTDGELGTGYDSASSGPWGWINEPIDPDPEDSGTNHVYGVFQRIPFTVDNLASYNTMTLKTDYDDAITVWLNGTKIYESATSPTFDSNHYTNNFNLIANNSHAASGNDALAPVYTSTTVSAYYDELIEGENLLVVANWNATTTSDDLISAVRLDLTYTAQPPRYYTAYNDCGQYNSSTLRSTGNVTNWGVSSSTWGTMVNYADGANTQVTFTYTEAGTTEGVGAENSVNNNPFRPPPVYPAMGTDAYTEFGTIINMGGISYGDTSATPITVTLSNLDNTKTYTLVATAMRGDPTYLRWGRFTLGGADSFVNESSSGTVITTLAKTNDSTTFEMGDNYANGYVAKWTNISTSGTSITLTARAVDFGGNPANKTYLSAIKLVQEQVSSFYVDVVDGSGVSIPDPVMAMSTTIFSSNYQTATGTLGTASEQIRVTNNTTNPEWSLTMAATDGPTAFWNGASTDYDFNDPTAEAGDGADADSLGGQMTVNPSGASLTPRSGCSNTGLSLGSQASFSQGPINSVSLLSAGGTAETDCYWDLTGVGISQTIPASQATGNYYLDMTMTLTAI